MKKLIMLLFANFLVLSALADTPTINSPPPCGSAVNNFCQCNALYNQLKQVGCSPDHNIICRVKLQKAESQLQSYDNIKTSACNTTESASCEGTLPVIGAKLNDPNLVYCGFLFK